MPLKEWASNTWLLHMIDHLTRFSASCVIKSKHKEVIVKKIFKIWISIFSSPKKFLADNEGEFNNHEFISLLENVNTHVCTMAVEALWSNSPVERHDAILGSTVATDNVKKISMDLSLIKYILQKSNFSS